MSALIVAIVNRKGGCGKTTLATNLTVTMLHEGHAVLLVDTDSQRSAQEWHAKREAAGVEPAVECVGMAEPNSMGALRRLSRGYDVVIIDGAGRLEERMQAAVNEADIVLIPVLPSAYDVWAAGEVVRLVELRQRATGGMPKAAFVITRAIVNTRLATDVREGLQEADLPTLATQVAQRQIYARTVLEGRSVLDAPASAGGKAAAVSELAQLTKELLEMQP